MNILTKFKDLTLESLKDNKKLIVGLYIVFIICFICGWIFTAERASTLASNIGTLNSTATPNMSVQANALDLFINNEMGGIVTYISSIIFTIPAILLLIYNAFNLGATGQLFSVLLPNGGLHYIIYLIPHGIFELTATVLESVAGILLFLFIFRFIKSWIKDHNSSEAFEKTKKILIQSLMIFILSTILLIIAAPIEAYVSVPVSDFIMGML